MHIKKGNLSQIALVQQKIIDMSLIVHNICVCGIQSTGVAGGRYWV
uniref:Uncharacterized protein n=1 Tax=Anguilla anguilla TaxID=7936 RepID=A0A0E9VFP1_ANGAN